MDAKHPAATTVEIEYRYKPMGSLGKQERGPMVVAWTTLPRVEGEPHAFHRHHLVSAARGKTTTTTTQYAAVRVKFPYGKDKEWRPDSCFRALLMNQVQSSEGKWTYEKAASTEVYLADLIAAKDRTVRVGMRVQSYYMPPPGKNSAAEVESERHKGDLVVQLVSQPDPSVRWTPGSESDLTPANVPAMQAAMMLAVTRNMSLYQPEIVGDAMPPTMPEIHNVHAPFYAGETQVTLDGATFFTRTADVARDHVDYQGGQAKAEKYLETLLRQSLARHNMTEGQFLAAARVFRTGRHDPAVSDAQLRRAVAALGTATTLRVNGMFYVSDTAVLSHSKKSVVVESFDQVDIRTDDPEDSGGASSYDVGVRVSASRFAASRDTATGGAMDCEDGARDAAVHFALIADPGAGLPNPRSKLVLAARGVASHYRAVGVLSSVLSRNLGDSQQQQQPQHAGPPDIGSSADKRVEVGAHMFTLLVPKRVLRRNVHRALASRGVRSARVDLGFTDREREALPPTPLRSGQDLPVALCEGTGILHPLMLARESYEVEHEARVAEAVGAVLDQEAQVRMRTGRGSLEIAQAAAAASAAAEKMAHEHPGTMVVLNMDSLHINAPKALDRFVPMHEQDRVVGDANKRIVATFYRTPAEMFLVPTAAQLEAQRERTESRPKQLVGDRMVPVQVGSRRSGGGGKDRHYSWGVSLTDILRQREFVGFLPTPEPGPAETRIVDRVQAHLAPAVALHLDEHMTSDRFIKRATGWPSVLSKQHGVTSAREAMGSVMRTKASSRRHSLIHGYAHPRDLTDQDIQALARWLKGNPHVVGASLVIERSTYHLATVRLDAVVDCGDTGDLAAGKLSKMIHQAGRPVYAAGALPYPLPGLARTFSLGLPGRPISFWWIMTKHIRLTVAYVEVSYRNRHARNDLPLDHPTVQALIRQFDDWAFAIRERASREGLELVARANRGEPAWEVWKKLILAHTVYAKQLADASWDPTRSAQKQEALSNITGANNQQIARFWGGLLRDDHHTHEQTTSLWGEHLRCTAAYIDALAQTDDPVSPKGRYRMAVAECLELGRQFGDVVDANLGTVRQI